MVTEISKALQSPYIYDSAWKFMHKSSDNLMVFHCIIHPDAQLQTLQFEQRTVQRNSFESPSFTKFCGRQQISK